MELSRVRVGIPIRTQGAEISQRARPVPQLYLMFLRGRLYFFGLSRHCRHACEIYPRLLRCFDLRPRERSVLLVFCIGFFFTKKKPLRI